MDQGRVEFPGIEQILSASGSIGHGISPGVHTVTIAPQEHFVAETGTLRISFAGQELELADCKIDYASFRWQRGYVWRLSIFDRRWKWSMGIISGSYNLRNDDGTIKFGTEKTPQELAQLCLEAIDEQGFNVGDLPNQARPQVEWDCDVPMECLARLCDELGCVIVLQLDGTVALRKIGQGAELPLGDDVLQNSLTIDLPEKPDKIAVVCGADRYQADLRLEAVGEDVDGEIKLIDHLSYRPAEGWGKVDLPFHVTVASESGWPEQGRAEESVFRWYRIKQVQDIPGTVLATSRDQILPCETEQVDSIIEDGIRKNKPAVIYGVWFRDADYGTDELPNVAEELTYLTDEEDPQVCSVAWNLDCQQGIVRFAEPVYRNTSEVAKSLVKGPAILRLRTTVRRRHSWSWAFQRHSKIRNTGGNLNTPTKYLLHDELVLCHTPGPDGLDPFCPGQEVNRQEIDAECDRILDAAEQQYEASPAQIVRYAGLKPINLDGAVRQLTYTVDGSGTATSITRNTEDCERAMPRKQQRAVECLREAVKIPPRPIAKAGAMLRQMFRWWAGR
jgi:hypothetical protein